ncbi:MULTISPECIES: hypothetical protein [Agrobacterium]|uniref:Uncharacterized protein n=1 Tax=Agrobacterium tumefaciens TaxID=358 RepID=A0AAE6BDH8_AGRTU|nr:MULTISPECIES: hypothetical protein [Agrobacterium]QCL73447.1 hypothetical protein CFBP5499_08480 [Agrobacterium tumefaciens]QCL79019.1 hypothetical protein CFBP5877_08010 [Agrobacterium tumefaciens]WCK01112.1 hypothetical protein G6L31_007465 [Agrobacterium tumefaciens]CUX41906.1 conserved exported hypothetical protein [Agrobacterium sp. NCPPB 925]
MMRRLCLLPTVLLVVISGPLQGTAEVEDGKDIKVSFIVTLAGADRISGTALCKTGETCRLVEHESPKLTIDLKAGRSYSEIEIRCKDDCSFNSGHETMIFENKQELDIYNGKSGPIVKSVWRRREPIGKIMLNFSDPSGMTR